MERNDIESIRIYADLNVYALFAEVEEEIGRMGKYSDEGDRLF